VCNYVGLYEYVCVIMWVYIRVCVYYYVGLYEYVCISGGYIVCVCNYVG
jgi:hypothetical protein